MIFLKDRFEEERLRERDYFEYKEWERGVKEKDKYTCRSCNRIGGKLVSHHLDGYHWCKKRRTDLDNGVTLCERCHENFHDEYGWRYNKESQYYEWLSKSKEKFVNCK